MPRSACRRLAIDGTTWGHELAVDVIQNYDALRDVSSEPMRLGLRLECCTAEGNELICQRSQQCGPNWAGIYWKKPPRGTYSVWVEVLHPRLSSIASPTSFQVRLSFGNGLAAQQRFNDIADTEGPRMVFQVTTPTESSWQLWKMIERQKGPIQPGVLGNSSARSPHSSRLRNTSPEDNTPTSTTPVRRVSFRKTRSVMLFEVSPQERMQKQKAWENVARSILMERLHDKMQAQLKEAAATSAANRGVA